MAHSRPFGSTLSLLLGAAPACLAQGSLGIDQPARMLPSGFWTTGISILAFSDPVPLHGAINQWQGNLSTVPSPVIYGQWKGFALATIGNWQVSTWDLTTILGEMSKDGAQLLWMTKQKQTLPVGKSFDLNFTLDSIHRTGISIGRAWRFAELTFGASLDYWTATGAQFGTAEGRASITGPKAYSFDVEVNYSYNQNRLYELAVPSERGWGAGLSVGATWTGKNWSWQLATRDLGNQTTWNRLPLTMAKAVSGRSHLNSNGYTIFEPSIEGWEGEKPYTWREPQAWVTSLERGFSTYSARVKIERFGPITLRTAEVDCSLSLGIKLTLGYEGRNHLWSAGGEWDHFWVRVGTASFSSQATHALQFELGAKGHW